MSDHRFTPRRTFLKAAAGTSLAAVGRLAFAQSFLPKEKRFEWLPTECADERYPMELVSGGLYGSDGLIAALPSGKTVNNGWGQIGSRHLIGAPHKPVPNSLKLSWFSYAEDQFFAGTVALPHAELTQLFERGFVGPLMGTRETWTKIIVGMGLGGWTSVWLAGGELVREVARAQLQAAQLNWALVLDNPAIERSAFIRSKLQSRLGKAELDLLARHGPPVGTWTRYAQRHRRRVVVAGVHMPLHMFLRRFNVERQFQDLAQPVPEALEAVPKHLQITWLTNNGRKQLSEIHLDESEVFGALDQAGVAASNTPPMILRVELGARSRVSMVLECQATRIPLTRARVEVSSLGN